MSDSTYNYNDPLPVKGRGCNSSPCCIKPSKSTFTVYCKPNNYCFMKSTSSNIQLAHELDWSLDLKKKNNKKCRPRSACEECTG